RKPCRTAGRSQRGKRSSSRLPGSEPVSVPTANVNLTFPGSGRKRLFHATWTGGTKPRRDPHDGLAGSGLIEFGAHSAGSLRGHPGFPARKVRVSEAIRRRFHLSRGQNTLKVAAPLHERIRSVTERIRERSAPTRSAYLDRMQQARSNDAVRARLSCTNLAHGFAAMDPSDKEKLRAARWPNLAIVSSYNDMLSAHRPLERYPELLKLGAREVGAVAQFAGGVPAMCDGITQGQAGMELSLFSRDTIAM